MSNVPTTPLDQLQQLRESFHEQLPARIGLIETAWQRLADGSWNVSAARELRALLHSMAGSAGTFGFPETSRQAHAAELKVDALMAAPDVSARARVEEMLKAIVVLKQVAAIEKPQPLAASIATGDSPNRIIYLVDDDQDFARDTALQLGFFGYEVRVFDEPSKLRDALQRERPAAILIDATSPDDVAGTNTLQELRNSRPDLPPLVFISMREEFPARLGAVRAGGNAYFTKPVDIGTLVDRLDRLTGVRPPEPYRVLIVDDSRQVAAAHALALQSAGLETAVVTEPMAVIAQLADFVPDLILMDVDMPECTGAELAAAIRQFDAYVSIPIVFLSADTDRDRQASALQQGGDEFLIKPIKPEHLIAAVTSRVERARILRSLMVRDSLTGLFNHIRIKEQVATEVARAQRNHSELAVAMIDIDHFKQVNDTYGHPVGDRVIKSLARLLQQRLRATDIVGRYGGEEFVAILPDTPADKARDVFDKIRESFHALSFRTASGAFVSSFSCGIAVFPAVNSAPALLDAADRALYEAKHAGRNCTVIATNGSSSGEARP